VVLEEPQQPTHINIRATSLRLIGGIDCRHGITPDLNVRGGARIEKTLCVQGKTMIDDLFVNGNLTVSGTSDLQGNVLIGGLTVIDNDIIVTGNSIVIGDSFTSNLTANNISILKNLLVCGNEHMDSSF
jgi:tetrahydrodipicolinate N-succinyltransferase